MRKLKNSKLSRHKLSNYVYHENLYFVGTTATVVVSMVVVVVVVLPRRQVEVHRLMAETNSKSDLGLGLGFLTFYFDLYYAVSGLVGSFLVLCELGLGLDW